MSSNETPDKTGVANDGPSHFIRNFIKEDIAKNKHGGKVQTRFPPEPNGYLHIGHSKAICLNFGLAEEFGGKCNLRFDDTNPAKEETEYVEAMKRDIKWLGYDWGNRELYASDYFDQLYEWAIELIKKGKAYVDDLNAEEIREYRGTLTEPGKESPYRNRSVDKNLDLFERMKNGEFPDGSKVLRAKIDMASPNVNMRDPVLYRILHASHHRTGDKWKIYPMYDWAHGQSDSIEEITHSLCTLEFEDHRPLYNWFIEQLGIFPSRQIEFSRFNLSYMITSKRFLASLISEGRLKDWDDPRMPTLSGVRRRGYTPESIRNLCDAIGVTKSDSIVDISQLDYWLREDLNKRAPRAMAVLHPLKLVIENYPEGQVEELHAVNNPEAPEMGKRKLPFSRELYIERDDFREEAPRKYRRLAPGKEVRLMHAYYVTCTDFIKDEQTGEVVEVRCTYDPQTRGGWSSDGRKVKGTIHWVSAAHAAAAEVRLYDHLFTIPNPTAANYKEHLNPNSLDVLADALVEPGLKNVEPGTHYQFLRNGYFVADPDSTKEKPVFNRTTPLRDSWAKIENKVT